MLAMNNFLSQLNLTAQERRIVAGIFLVVIVVLNYLFVWPHFGDWSSMNNQLKDMRAKIEKDNDFIKKDYASNGWKKQVEELTHLEGGSVMTHPIDPQVQLQNTIRAQERKTGVYVKSINPGSVKTNEFFETQSTAISLECQEPQLVDFLYNMGMDPAMIRVAILNLRPADANRYRLQATITLTANYTKKPPASVSAATVEKRPPGVKPAATPAAKPPASAAGKPRGVPAPVPGSPAKNPSGGAPIGPGFNKRPPFGANPVIPARPPPLPKPGAGQKASD
jgi:hypothetical protein